MTGETRTEAGELSDAELNLVTGGGNVGTGAELKQVVSDVDRIQDLLADFAKPASAGPGTKSFGNHADSKDELILAKELGTLIGNFEKSHDLESKGKAIQAVEDQFGKKAGKAQTDYDADFKKAKGTGPAEAKDTSDIDQKSILKKLDGKIADGRKDADQEADKIARSTGKGGGVVSDAEATKLSQIKATLERLSEIDPKRSKSKSATLDDDINALLKTKKTANDRTSPTEDIAALKKAAADEDRERLARNKLLGKPADAPETRATLIEDLKKLRKEFEEIQIKEAGKPGPGAIKTFDIKAPGKI